MRLTVLLLVILFSGVSPRPSRAEPGNPLLYHIIHTAPEIQRSILQYLNSADVNALSCYLEQEKAKVQEQEKAKFRFVDEIESQSGTLHGKERQAEAEVMV